MSATTKTRELSSYAAAAKMIRAKLKTAYPRIAFSVTSKGYSMGNSVSVNWTDGPTTDAVEKIIACHQYGHFDGMIDLYEYSNTRDDIPQAKYVHGSRRMSPESLAQMIEIVNARFGYALRLDGHGWIDPASDKHTGHGWQSHELHRAYQSLSLVCALCGSPTQPADSYCPDCGANLARAEEQRAELDAYWSASASAKGPRADITR